MATVPPADRTSPSLDPRYPPVFQRGYDDPSAERRPDTAERRPETRLRTSAPPSSAPERPTSRTAPPQSPASHPAAPQRSVPQLSAPVSSAPVASAPAASAPFSAPPASAPAGLPGTAPALPDEQAPDGPPPADTAPSEDAPRAARRLRTGPLWLVSAALVVAGVLLHFASAATGYGTDWSVFTQNGSLRFADGRSIEQVLAAQLAVAVAPQLVVLGVATAVATLFVTILRSERGTR